MHCCSLCLSIMSQSLLCKRSEANLPASTSLFLAASCWLLASSQFFNTCTMAQALPCGVCHCSIGQRAELLRHGLGDRVQSVRHSAHHLLQTWLDEACNKDVVKLLTLIGVQQHTGKDMPDTGMSPSAVNASLAHCSECGRGEALWLLARGSLMLAQCCMVLLVYVGTLL